MNYARFTVKNYGNRNTGNQTYSKEIQKVLSPSLGASFGAARKTKNFQREYEIDGQTIIRQQLHRATG